MFDVFSLQSFPDHVQKKKDNDTLGIQTRNKYCNGILTAVKISRFFVSPIFLPGKRNPYSQRQESKEPASLRARQENLLFIVFFSNVKVYPGFSCPSL